jgi:hypothetical protein
VSTAVAVSRRSEWRDRLPVARALAMAIALGIAVFGALLIAASFLPSATVAARLLGVAGEADRSGAHTVDLLAHFGDRLRFVGAAFLVLAAMLAVLRLPFESMLRGTVVDLRQRRRWQVQPRHVLLVGIVSLAALGLRLLFLNQPMRYDEALTFTEFASRPLYYGLSYYPDPNNHLLNTLLVHAAFSVLGNQPWVLRLPALLAGVLLVPVTYALARVLYPLRPATAVLAAALVGTSSYLVEYSTNSRGYTLQTLCFVVMLTFVELALRRQSASALLLAGVVGALGVYALPTMIYGIAVAAAWFALRARGSRSMPRLMVAGVVLALVALLLYLPALLISGPEALTGNRFVVSLGAADLWQQLPSSLTRTWAFWNRDMPATLSAVLVLGFAASVALDGRERRVSIGLVAAAVCLVLVLAQRVAPFERVWLFLLPLYFLVAADGLVRLTGAVVSGVARRGASRAAPGRSGRGERIGGEWVGVVAAGAVMAVIAVAVVGSGSILASPETGAFPDAEGVARALRSGDLQPEDAVVTQVPASLPELQYYFPRLGLSTEPLVRDPSQGARLFVVAAPGMLAPKVPGWGQPRTIASFKTAELVELARD